MEPPNPTTPARPRGVRRAALSAAGVLAVSLAGCGDEATIDAGISGPPLTSTSLPPATPSTTAALPSWLRSVQPVPGAPASATMAVEVQFPVLGEADELRLSVDGVDVTSQSFERRPTGPTGPGTITPFPGPGRLRYEPRSLEAPLQPLGPGEHVARVELIRRVAFGQPGQVLDAFQWRFTVL